MHEIDLRGVSIFEGLDPREFVQLGRSFRTRPVTARQVVLRQGDRSEHFFIIEEGTFAVYRDAIGEPTQLLATLGPGEFFGELGLLNDTRCTASVRAQVAGHLLEIPRLDLAEFLATHPEVGERLQNLAAHRMTANMVAKLDLSRQREVRIRCQQELELRLTDGSRRRVVLENLSVGGLCLADAPEGWTEGESVYFWLSLREGELELSGRVAWREDDRLGMVFEKRTPDHDMIIQMAIRLLLAMG